MTFKCDECAGKYHDHQARLLEDALLCLPCYVEKKEEHRVLEKA